MSGTEDLDYGRLANRGLVTPVHQNDLDMEEKILRHFDLSSQYGVREVPSCSSTKSPEHMLTLSQPCIGIARLKRWRRANMLKLNPPIEVLAVLLKDGNVCERAHMDELLS